MKIVVINGTEVKQCTYQIKEAFLNELREGNEIKEFYFPKDMNYFCCGCKTCFLKDENKCPHASQVMPIWNAMLEADLIVFAYPTYALRVPASVKALLDHLCVHWMVHRPDKRMFTKRAVVLTQAIGMFYKGALKDVKTSLNWLGVSAVKCQGFGLFEGVIWNDLSQKRRDKIINRVKKMARKHKKIKPARKSIKIKCFFKICKIMHKMVLKKEVNISVDNQHYINNGWIKNKN